MALFPMSFFLSAVYSESLYLALSIGVFWSARRGRFVIACALAGLAAATRSAGIVLLVPIASCTSTGRAQTGPPIARAPARLQPRYRLRRDALAVALVPARAGRVHGLPRARAATTRLLPLHAQAVWSREFAGPVHALWLAGVAAFDGVRQIASGRPPTSTSPPATAIRSSPPSTTSPTALPARRRRGARRRAADAPARLRGVRARRAGHAALLSGRYEPLMSMPRFVLVLFPLFMWGGARLAAAPRWRAPVFAGSALSARLFVAQFATWHWVACSGGAAAPPLRAVLLDAMGTLSARRAGRRRSWRSPACAPRRSSRPSRRAWRSRPRSPTTATITTRAATRDSLRGSAPAAARGLLARRLPAAARALGRRGPLASLLAALRFRAFDDAAPALTALRRSGRRLAVVSNWDVSLHEALAESGSTTHLDAVVTSAEPSARESPPRPSSPPRSRGSASAPGGRARRRQPRARRGGRRAADCGRSCCAATATRGRRCVRRPGDRLARAAAGPAPRRPALTGAPVPTRKLMTVR